MKKNQGQMRLQREGKMAIKDMEKQMKKSGKITDNFICLPDPSDPYVWYYVVYGLQEPKAYTGGYYLGKITCPPDYPAKAPNIRIITENGRFKTTQGICLSISDFHPESWNPAWKVNQIVIGLISFWIANEYTYGAVEPYYDYPRDDPINKDDRIIQFSKESRKSVLEHAKFKEIFADYADAIGINNEPDV